MTNREKPLLSIVIPCWFTKEQHGKYGKHETFWFASHCLNQLLKVTDRSKFELILIDNGSTLTDEDIEAEFHGEKALATNVSKYWSLADIVIKNKENLGFAPACNQGFALARGEYVACINDDIYVWEGWDDALIEALNIPFEIKPGISMPALMKETRDAAEVLQVTKDLIDLETNAGKFGPGAEFGSLWMTKKDILDELIERDGYVFDEKFLLGMGEDRDLWDRVRTLGYETYRTHATRVFHQGNMTIGKVPDRKVYTTKNREYLEEKRARRKAELEQ